MVPLGSDSLPFSDLSIHAAGLADGQEALAAAMQHHPDLVLLDVMMPHLDGIETCRRLKDDATFPFLPIILVTAKMDSKDIVAGLDAGADEYLTKPVDQAALVARGAQWPDSGRCKSARRGRSAGGVGSSRRTRPQGLPPIGQSIQRA